MARNFQNTYVGLNNLTGPADGYPLTIACWFRPERVTTFETIVSIAASSEQSKVALMLRGDTAGDPVGALTENSLGSAKVAISTTGVTQNKWHHGAAVFRASNHRRAYIDGGDVGTQANDRVPTNLDRTTIGDDLTTGPLSHFQGDIAEVGIWNVALSDEDVALLGRRRYSPPMVRPGALLFYAPLLEKGNTWSKGVSTRRAILVASGPPTMSMHPPGIIYPVKNRQRFKAPAAAGGGRIMSSLAHRGGLVGAGGIAGAGGGLAS